MPARTLRRGALAVFALLAVPLAGNKCNPEDRIEFAFDTAPRDTTPADVAPDVPAATADPGTPAVDEGPAKPDCSAYTPAAPPEAVEAAFRPEAAAELLAIEATGDLVADQDLYDDVARHLATIRAQIPELADIRHRPSWEPDRLRLQLTTAARQAAAAQRLFALDCLHEAYAIDLVRLTDDGVQISAPKRFHAPRLAIEYLTVPEVVAADPVPIEGDGPDICLEIDREAEIFSFVFDQATGDCENGCLDHIYRGYKVERGFIQPLGTWTRRVGEAPPPWFAELEACRGWL